MQPRPLQLQAAIYKQAHIACAQISALYARVWAERGAADHTQLMAAARAGHAICLSAAARAALLIVPGFNSHSGYYAWTAEHLAQRGIAVYALDLRGRGRSAGERFYVDRFSDYVDDVALLAQHIRERDAALPLYLLGHSAGGVIACLYTLDHQSELAGLIELSEHVALGVGAGVVGGLLPDAALGLQLQAATANYPISLRLKLGMLWPQRYPVASGDRS